MSEGVLPDQSSDKTPRYFAIELIENQKPVYVIAERVTIVSLENDRVAADFIAQQISQKPLKAAVFLTGSDGGKLHETVQSFQSGKLASDININIFNQTDQSK